MACHLFGAKPLPEPMLNSLDTHRNTFQLNSIRNQDIFAGKIFVVYLMSGISFRPQCVNTMSSSDTMMYPTGNLFHKFTETRAIYHRPRKWLVFRLAPRHFSKQCNFLQTVGIVTGRLISILGSRNSNLDLNKMDDFLQTAFSNANFLKRSFAFQINCH